MSTILLPVFAQVGLTFGLGFWMAAMRLSALRSRKVRPQDVALRQAAWPEKVTKIANSYQNQFEAPVLFYLVALLAVVTGKEGGLFVALSWMFFATRLTHAFIHTGSNNLLWRFIWFASGAAVLLIMWILFAFDILAGV
jgi:hypothetical protein